MGPKKVQRNLNGHGLSKLQNFILENCIIEDQAQGSTDAIFKNFVAGEDINGGKAVMIDTDGKVYLFDILNPYHYDKYLGISSTAVLAGQQCTIVTHGKNTTLGPGWLSGRPYYIATGGDLSTTPPSLGFLKQIGVGIDTDTIMIVAANQYVKT